MNISDVFLQKKLRLTEQLLQGFDIASDLAIYHPKITIRDGVSHRYVDARSYHPSMLPRSLDSHEHLSMFPVVFDYLDLMVDKNHGTRNLKFSRKLEVFRCNNHQPDPLLRHIQAMVFGYAITLRNKLVHHQTRFSACGKFLHVRRGMKLVIGHFGLLNRLVYFLVRLMQTNELLSLYRKALLVTAYRTVFGHLDTQLDSVAASVAQFPVMQVQLPRYLYDLSQEDIAEDVVMFEKFSRPPDPTGYPDREAFIKANPDPDRKIMYGNYTYLLGYRGKVLRVPAELIIQHPTNRLADFHQWLEHVS